MPLVTYTVLRLLLFVAALGLGYVAGVRGWLLAVVALVVSFAVSYLALPKQKDAAAAWLQARAERRAAERGSAKETLDSRIAEDAAAEDAVFDASVTDAPVTDTAESPNRRPGA